MNQQAVASNTRDTKNEKRPNILASQDLTYTSYENPHKKQKLENSDEDNKMTQTSATQTLTQNMNKRHQNISQGFHAYRSNQEIKD